MKRYVKVALFVLFLLVIVSIAACNPQQSQQSTIPPVTPTHEATATLVVPTASPTPVYVLPTPLPLMGTKVEIEQMRSIGTNQWFTLEELYQRDADEAFGPIFLLVSSYEYIVTWQELVITGLPESLDPKGVYIVWEDYRLYEVDPNGRYTFKVVVIDPLLYIESVKQENGGSFFGNLNVNPVLP